MNTNYNIKGRYNMVTTKYNPKPLHNTKTYKLKKPNLPRHAVKDRKRMKL